MTEIPYLLVDAFSTRPLFGNPVAVFFSQTLESHEMAAIAREMNLSEVTFVTGLDVSAARAEVRIFTPTMELPFAGHPLIGTLGAIAARAGFEGELRVDVPWGTIACTIGRRKGHAWTSFTLPAAEPEPFFESETVLKALGVQSVEAPVVLYDVGARHVLVAVASYEQLASIRPDFRALGDFPDVAFNCFAGTAGSWRNRMFSPSYGVVEDAATGSAAAPILLHAQAHLNAPQGQWCCIEQGIGLGREAKMYARSLECIGKPKWTQTAGHCIVVGEGKLFI